MAFQPKVKIKLSVDRHFGSTQGEAGKTYEVDPFWANALIAEGSAEEVVKGGKDTDADDEDDTPKGKKK